MSYWRSLAACLGMDPEMWFPFPAKAKEVKQATDVCNRCPVQPECLTFALTSPPERYGIWGGLTEKQRDELLRRRSVGAAS